MDKSASILSKETAYAEWLTEMMEDSGIDEDALEEAFRKTPALKMSEIDSRVRGAKPSKRKADVREYLAGKPPMPAAAFRLGRALRSCGAPTCGLASVAMAACGIPRVSSGDDEMSAVLSAVRASVSAAVSQIVVESEIAEDWDKAYALWHGGRDEPFYPDDFPVPEDWTVVFRILEDLHGVHRVSRNATKRIGRRRKTG